MDIYGWRQASARVTPGALPCHSLEPTLPARRGRPLGGLVGAAGRRLTPDPGQGFFSSPRFTLDTLSAAFRFEVPAHWAR